MCNKLLDRLYLSIFGVSIIPKLLTGILFEVPFLVLLSLAAGDDNIPNHYFSIHSYNISNNHNFVVSLFSPT